MLKLTEEERVQKREQAVKFDFAMAGILIFLALLLPVFSILYSSSAANVPDNFQRSGGITSILALWVEIKYGSILSNINPYTAFTTYPQESLRSKYFKITKILGKFSFPIACMGALISCYGDWIYKYFCR